MNHPLSDLLPIAVNMRITKIIARGDIADNWEYYRSYLEQFNERCLNEPSFSESMLFKIKPGQSAESFNALAEAIAILSFVPGGVELGGIRFDSSGFVRQSESSLREADARRLATASLMPRRFPSSPLAQR
ncbi:hypothetical protein GS682_04665 [Nostoc sp. B(2019)]|nr:hypothetical protein [Nostoc sp. B(2019)]